MARAYGRAGIGALTANLPSMGPRRVLLAVLAIGLLPLGPALAQELPENLPAVPTVPAQDLDVVPAAVQEAMGCDPLDPALCLFPFPNDFFTVADPTTATGRRIDFIRWPRCRATAPTSRRRGGGEGKPIDPTEWNRNDGFSPGQAVLTYVPGLDLHRTWGTQDRAHSEVGLNEPGYFDHRDHIADIDLYRRADAPMVILDAETGERHPFWSELDTHPRTPRTRSAC